MDENGVYFITEQQEAAEEAIVGSILIDPRCLDGVQGMVRAEMFSMENTRTAFTTAILLRDSGQPVDPVTLVTKMQELGQEVKRSWILHVMDDTVTAANVEAYCEVLRNEYIRRCVWLELDRQKRRLLEGAAPQEVSTDVIEAMERIAKEEMTGSGVVTASDATVELWDTIQQIQEGTKKPAMRTGYGSLERILKGGFQRNGFYILAARPGKGKTTMALNIANKISKAGRRVLFISLEMDREQLVSRILASEIGGVSAAEILNGEITTEEEWAELSRVGTGFSKQPIVFNRQESLNVTEIRYLAKVSHAELVVIDYLGLIQNENEGGKLYEEVTKNSKRLKLMARNLGIPILCLAQLNRESDKRPGKKPALSDLRDSGSIEQDADGVIFHYVNEAANAISDPGEDRENLDLIVAKNRHGPTGEVSMVWSKKDGRILEVSDENVW